MAKFTWQDGTLVSKAKVEIGGTIYEVDPEEYSGATPLSASNLNAMQDGIYEDINKTITGGTNYVKFSDGTLIFWGNVGPFDVNTSSGKQNVITLPENYKDTDFSVIASIKHGGAYWTSAHIKAEATSTNEINVEIYNDSPTNIVRNISASYFTVGKWK